MYREMNMEPSREDQEEEGLIIILSLEVTKARKKKTRIER